MINKEIALQIFALGLATAWKSARHALDPDEHFENPKLADVMRELKSQDGAPPALEDWLASLGVAHWKSSGRRMLDVIIEALAIDAEYEKQWTRVVTVINSTTKRHGESVVRKLSREDKEQFLKAVRTLTPPRIP